MPTEFIAVVDTDDDQIRAQATDEVIFANGDIDLQGYNLLNRGNEPAMPAIPEGEKKASAQTTDSTFTALVADEVNGLQLPTDGIWAYEALICGVSTDGFHAAAYKVTGALKRDGFAGPIHLATPVVVSLGESNQNMDCQAGVNLNSLHFQVKGLDAVTMNWAASVRVSEAVGA